MLLVSSHDELSSKFRPAEESHPWFSLGRGSDVRRGVHVGAQTPSLHTAADILGGLLPEYCLYSLCVTALKWRNFFVEVLIWDLSD